MNDRLDDVLLEFLKQKTLQGRLESTAPEIANGANLVYNQVGRALERLIMKDRVGYRERCFWQVKRDPPPVSQKGTTPG